MSRTPQDEHQKPANGQKNLLPDPRLPAFDRLYAIVFGFFLGLCIWKFGNPVILDQKISPPASPSEFWHEAWPLHWANWIIFPLVLIGILKAVAERRLRPATEHGFKWLLFLPLLWFTWQLFCGIQTVDPGLTMTTLRQFFGCVACYFLGSFLFGNIASRYLLLIGIMAAFAFCLVRAVDQKLIEFPQTHQMLVEGDRAGWTNVPPETIQQMKRDNVLITTNGLDIANPVVLAKFSKGRVMGTLVYPNALAGMILLLFPVSLTLAFSQKLRPSVRVVAVLMTLILGGIAFYASGSKAGWLIAMAAGSIYLFRPAWPLRFKIVTLLAVAVLGLGIFAVRFHNYFAAGATSVTARFDYWHAAVRTTVSHPVFGTGPGTFQRPYARIKSPTAEMARLAHNDYLEQFSDSGLPGGILYMCWIVLALVAAGKRVWKNGDSLSFALFIGLLGWFIQSFGEFGLYIPALAWPAFTLLGNLIAPAGNEFDKKTLSR